MFGGSPTLSFEFLAEILVVTRRPLNVLAACMRPFGGRHRTQVPQERLRTMLPRSRTSVAKINWDWRGGPGKWSPLHLGMAVQWLLVCGTSDESLSHPYSKGIVKGERWGGDHVSIYVNCPWRGAESVACHKSGFSTLMIGPTVYPVDSRPGPGVLAA